MANRAVPVIIQLVLFYFILSLVVRAVRRRRTQAPPDKHPSRAFRPEPPSSASPASRSGTTPTGAGAVRREERLYNGVVWQLVHRPHRSLAEGAPSRAAGDEVYVEEPPRCPKCGLGVVETHSWLGYTWACPECGTRSRSQASIEQTARMLARRQH